jgi:hypothetical protein
MEEPVAQIEPTYTYEWGRRFVIYDKPEVVKTQLVCSPRDKFTELRIDEETAAEPGKPYAWMTLPKVGRYFGQKILEFEGKTYLYADGIYEDRKIYNSEFGQSTRIIYEQHDGGNITVHCRYTPPYFVVNEE